MPRTRKVISLTTPDTAFYQNPADLADNKITDNTILKFRVGAAEPNLVPWQIIFTGFRD